MPLGCLVFLSLRAPGAGTYKLAALYFPGEQHRYEVTTAIQGMLDQGKAVALQFALRYKVTKILPSGTKLALTYDQPRSGSYPLGMTFKPAMITLDKYNRPINGSHSSQVFALMPIHPVKIGDKWNGSYDLVLGNSKGALLDVTYKLDGVKNERGREIGVLSMSLKGLAPGEGTSLIDMKDGSVLTTALNVSLRGPERRSYPVQIIVKRQS